MPRKSKTDFTTEKGIRAALSSIAKSMTAYSKTYGNDDDKVIAEAMITGVRDSLGATYKNVQMKDTGKVKSVRDKDVFDIVFKTEEVVDKKTGLTYTKYTLADRSDDYSAVIKQTIKQSKKEPGDYVVRDTTGKLIVDPVSGEPANKKVKQLSRIENVYSNVDTLTSQKQFIGKEISSGWIERDKTMKMPEQVKSIMVQRAKDYLDAAMSDIDEAFNIVSEAIKTGEMEGLQSIIWHDGRQATMSDIQEVLDAAGRLQP